MREIWFGSGNSIARLLTSPKKRKRAWALSSLSLCRSSVPGLG